MNKYEILYNHLKKKVGSDAARIIIYKVYCDDSNKTYKIYKMKKINIDEERNENLYRYIRIKFEIRNDIDRMDSMDVDTVAYKIWADTIDAKINRYFE